MGTSHLKSASITNLDATPVVANTSGQGAKATLRQVNGFVTAVAADAAGSTYQLARVPSNAVVKHLFFESEAQGAGKVQIGVYYSDSTVDGTAAANQGVVVPTTGVDFFASDVDCSSAVNAADYVGGGGTTTRNNLSLRNKELWDALGLTSDPGGFFDIVATVHTTAVTTGTGRLGASVIYAD